MTQFLNSPNRWYLLPTVTIFGLLLTGCGCGIDGLNFGREVVVTQRTLELSTMGVEKVAVTTTNGKVKFSPATGESEAIEVQVSIRASGNDQLSAQMTADAVEILTPMEGENGATQAIRWEWRGGQRPPGSATVSFEVTLPGHLAVAGKSTNGALEVEGTHSACELASTNGRITVSGAPGPCKIITTNGRVQVKGDLPSCDVSATNGSIDVHGGTERLSIKTTNGRIEAKTYAKELYLESKNSQIEAEMFRGSGISGHVKSHNGSIRLRMADDANIQLVCNTHNGRIDYDDLENALITIDRKSGGKRIRKLTATLGQGVAPLTVSTHNGSIRLKQGLDEWELAPPEGDEEKEVSQNTATAPRWVVVDGKRIEIDAQGVVLESGATVKLSENGDVIISRPSPGAQATASEVPAPADAPPAVVESKPAEPAKAAEPAEPVKAAESVKPGAAPESAKPSDVVEPTEPVEPNEPAEADAAQASDDVAEPVETENTEDAEPADDETPESDEPANATDD